MPIVTTVIYTKTEMPCGWLGCSFANIFLGLSLRDHIFLGPGYGNTLLGEISQAFDTIIIYSKE